MEKKKKTDIMQKYPYSGFLKKKNCWLLKKL